MTDESYRLLADALPHIVWTARPDGWVDYYNRRWYDYTGLSPRETEGWGWERTVHPDDLQRCRDCWCRAVESGEDYQAEQRLRQADGAYRWHLDRAIPLRAADGRILKWFGTCTDIDAQKRGEEERAALLAREQAALAQAAARAAESEVVFEAMVDGVIVCAADASILHINRAFRRLLSIDRAVSYASLSMEERVALITLRDEHGQPLPPDRWPITRLLQGDVLTQPVDVTVRAFDGREILLSMAGAPVRDAQGRVVASVCICRDVTEQRRLERRTHAALNALLTMAEAVVLAPDAGAVEPGARGMSDTASAAGHRLAELTRDVLGCRHVAMVAVEPATDRLHPVAVAGFSPEHERAWWHQWTIGMRLHDRLAADHIAALRADNALSLDRTQPPFSSSTAFGRRAVLMVPLRVAGQLTGILSVDYDKTTHEYTAEEVALVRAVGRLAALVIERERLLRQQAEAQANELALREANRRMDEFMGIAGHEMRTPLTTIKGNIQLVQRRLARLAAPGEAGAPGTSGLGDIQRLLERADAQMRRVNRLVDDLLDVSRIQAGRLQLNLAPCNLSGIVRDSVEEQRQIEPDRAIVMDVPDGEIPVLADGFRIGQVVTNYLTNALKYAPPPAPITVSLRTTGTEARVLVRDEGPGLPVGEAERVWERFYRVSGVGPQQGSGVGLGLGLHISRTIVERHGGCVGVDSAPGHGATFWFALPLAE